MNKINTEMFPKVKPVVIKPNCLKQGKKQDCFNCDLYKNNLCDSPRGWCAKKYHNHPKGCPNYGRYALCPPNAPMFDEIFDMTKDFYLVYIKYDIKSHIEKMKERHPNWNERQLRNVLYWQGTAKKMHKEKAKEFIKLYGHLGYEIVIPEAMGLNLSETIKQVGINLEWPPSNFSYRIGIAGIPLPGKSIKDYETCKNNKLTNIN